MEIEQTDPNPNSLQPGTGRTPALQSPGLVPQASWMTSSPLTALTPAEIPAGLVSRTAAHWFTVGTLFGRATIRSVIIFYMKTDPNLTGMLAQTENPRGKGLLGRFLEFPASGPLRNSTRP